VEPVKRTGDDADKFAEPITTTAPKRDNLGTASLTAIEEESQKPQTQTGSTDEVRQSHSHRKRDKIPHSPTPGTYSNQQVQPSIENLGNRKRKGGSDDELQHPSTLRLDTTIPWQVKRSRGFTGEYVKPTTTSSRNAAPLTTHETEKSALTDVSLSPVARVTHGFHPRAAGTHDGGPPTDASPSQPDTKKCIQVGRETYAVTSQPGTSSPFDTGIDTATCGAIVGRETIAPPLIGTSQVQRLQPVTNPTEHTNQNTLLITQPETPNTHHVEESIVFYDSSQTPKRRLSSGTRKRMKLHPP